jgi:hypothetical protein
MADETPVKITRTEVKTYSTFKKHLIAFIIVIGALWIFWLIKGNLILSAWLMIPTILWFVVILIHWTIAYEIFQKRKMS